MVRLRKSNQNPITKLAVLSILLPPLVITPWWNFDPINIPRLLVLSTLAGGSLNFLLSKDFRRKYYHVIVENRLIYFLSFTFILCLIASLLFAKAPIWAQLYGTQGRNTGLVAFLSLIILMLALIYVNVDEIVNSLTKVMYIVMISNIGYGLIQDFGFDPIKWQNQYSPVIGTMGNPNFYSAFIAIGTIFLMSRIIFSTKFLSGHNVIDATLLFATLYLQTKTASIQGFLMVGIGVLILFFLKSRMYRFYLSSRLFFCLIGVAGISVFLSFLGKGPFGELLLQRSLVLRTYFWEVAFKMGLERPWTGFGIDSFGNWYRTFRTEKVVTNFWAGVVTDSAHSVYFDLLAGAGFLSTIAFIAIQVYIFVRAIKFILNKEVNNQIQAFILTAWIALLAQSIISVNSLAISSLGFAFGGMLLGTITRSSQGSNQIAETRFSSAKSFYSYVGAVVCFSLVLPIFIKDIQFRSVISQTDGQKMIAFTENWPANDFQMLFIAKLLYSNGYEELGRKMTYRALEINPRNVNALLTLAEDSKLSKGEKLLIMNRLQSIDPLNKSLKDLNT